jgi:hypothetical protein
MIPDNIQRNAFQLLTGIIRQDPGERGFAGLVAQDDLYRAAASLLDSRRVIIVTGFCVVECLIGETDGPPGALVLANALTKLKKEVLIVTDQFSSVLLRAGMSCYRQSFEIVEVPLSQRLADSFLLQMLKHYHPDHIVSIERPGMAADGNSYSMRGEMLNRTVPLMDLLFSDPSADSVCKIAVGDGGNELGMGKVHELISSRVHLGDKIGCVTPADFLVPAGVSNWGAYGIAAGLSLLSKQNLLPDRHSEILALKAMVAAGAVDGCTKRNELSVDGLPFDEYLDVIRRIYDLVSDLRETEFLRKRRTC